MTQTLSPTPRDARPRARSQAASRPCRDAAEQPHAPRRAGAREHSLGRYLDDLGRAREVVARAAAGDSALLLDRDAATHGDCRVLAHLGADEPAQNGGLICAQYLRDAARQRRVPRRLHEDDLAGVGEGVTRAPAPAAAIHPAPVEGPGCSYRLAPQAGSLSIPELRWQRCASDGDGERAAIVSLREAIAHLQSYEPLRSLTDLALRACRDREGVSSTVLRLELERVNASPIVLNRGLREAVLAALQRDRLSMSEIALRCGRVKRDANGNESGETSWLARRIGLLPEGGQRVPTPWIHSDVLALIARRGIGISPREVELG